VFRNSKLINNRIYYIPQLDLLFLFKNSSWGDTPQIPQNIHTIGLDLPFLFEILKIILKQLKKIYICRTKQKKK
jgi:hypothetical protein